MQLNVRMEGQVQTNWCWAAVTAAVVNHLEDRHVRQCDIASEFFGGADCCTDPARFDSLERIREVLAELRILREPEQNAIEDALISAELEAGRPIPARIAFVRSERVHFVLITGLLPNGNKIVLDPDGPVERELTDGELRFQYPSNDGSADGSWSNSYLVQRRS